MHDMFKKLYNKLFKTTKLLEPSDILHRSPFGHVYYTIVCSPAQYERLAEICGIAPDCDSGGYDAHVSTFSPETLKGDTLCVIYMPPKQDWPMACKIGMLVHECTHIWQRIEKEMNDNDRSSSEFEAYSIQRIVIDMWHLYEELEQDALEEST